MRKRTFTFFICLLLAVTAIPWIVDQGFAETPAGVQAQAVQAAPQSTQTPYLQRLREAQARLQQEIAARHKLDPNFPPPLPEFQTPPSVAPLAQLIGFNPFVNYSLPNFAYSPNLRKFVDGLPGLGAANANNLGQYIPVAVPDTTTYPGSDYYELTIREYAEQMHSDLPGPCTTTLGGVTTCGGLTPKTTILRGYAQTNLGDTSNHYLGPLIIARSYDPRKAPGINGNGKPVRIKYTNQLSTLNTPLGGAFGLFGNLPIPVDTTLMGANTGPLGGTEMYTQNRATIHLHGGFTPWISDGTPHTWITPFGETTSYPKGVSSVDVPDMITGASCAANGGPNPGACITPSPTDGAMTLYYTNQQSSRLMFYHDHAFGITRLNVYDGVAAGYLLTDQVEDDLITGSNVSGIFNGTALAGTSILPNLGGVYKYGIPLVIEDKSYVNDPTGANGPATPPGPGFPSAAIATPSPDTYVVDPLWIWGAGGGSLWFPHEYMPNENIYDPSGMLAMGRWDYGPFMNPPALVVNNTLPSPSSTPESFADTMTVNGTAYPTLTVPPSAVRFQILSVGNDRMLNLQLYYAAVAPASVDFSNGSGTGATAIATMSAGKVTDVTVTNGGSGYASNFAIIFQDVPGGTGAGAAATAVVSGGAVTGITLTNGGTSPYLAGTICKASAGALPAGVTKRMCTEVAMVPAVPRKDYPMWPKDGRDGGVPDPTTAGPDFLMIGTEGGIMPQVAVLHQQPVDFVYNRKLPTFGDICPSFASGFCSGPGKTLLLGPAERADIVVDFSDPTVPKGSVFVLYNDAPAPNPLFDPRYDLYTGDEDYTSSGGAPMTPPGFGPNTRTIMQIATDPLGITTPFSLAHLQTMLPKAYKASQDPPIMPESAYNAAFGTSYVDIYPNNLSQTLNTTGAPTTVSSVMTTLPGIAYTAPPLVVFSGGHPTGCIAPVCTNAVATAALNGVIGVTVTTSGAGCTSVPSVSFTNGTGGVGSGAAAVASISGGVVTGVTVTKPGQNYTVIPNVVFGAGCTTPPVAVASIQPGSVGQITVTSPGSGYTYPPSVLLVSSNGVGQGAAAAARLTGDIPLGLVGITEGFEVWFGRINVVLGTTPNALNPLAPAPAVPGIAAYIDPPSDFITTGQPSIWRITHLGVDSHAVHIHLINFQVINRVDFTNDNLPPETFELGWKDTVRTSPFTDTFVAFIPKAMVLPFQLPHSVRYLDPTSGPGATANFPAVIPAPGAPVPAALSNVLTDFGFEYVWHCHLLGHEEDDMMRPLVLTPSVIPAVFHNPMDVGVYNPLNRMFSLNAIPSNLVFSFGSIGDKPIVGDWTGKGFYSVGVYRPSTGNFYLKNTNTSGLADITFNFTGALPTDIPVAGDWTGKGFMTVGLYRPSTRTFMLKNTHVTGAADTTFVYGAAGDIPVVGDWDGNGTTTVGVYRPSTRQYLLRNSNTAGANDIPTFSYGSVGDIPIVGDWDGNGTVTAGVYRAAIPGFLMRNTNTAGPADLTTIYGAAGVVPLAGAWK